MKFEIDIMEFIVLKRNDFYNVNTSDQNCSTLVLIL
jgi:hypothetical protein